MTSLLIAASAWSVGGFVLGFITCWLVIHARSKEVVDEKGSVVVSTKFDKLQTAIGVVILLLLILSSVSYYRRTECQTQYNRAVAEALIARSEAQRVESIAQIDLLTASMGTDRAAARQETLDYIEAVRELERARLAAPLPSAPDCGGWA